MTKAKTQTVPVSERALFQRIQRKLADDERAWKLKQARDGTQASFDLGTFFVLDTKRNVAVKWKIDLEAYGRELRVLADFESVMWSEEKR
jgi:hypothetical protein